MFWSQLRAIIHSPNHWFVRSVSKNDPLFRLKFFITHGNKSLLLLAAVKEIGPRLGADGGIIVEIVGVTNQLHWGSRGADGLAF